MIQITKYFNFLSFPAPPPLVLSEGQPMNPTIKPTPTSTLLATTQANLITSNNVLLTVS